VREVDRRGLPVARAGKGTVADAQRRDPDRFLGAATVPFDALEASILKARRAVWELGLQAVLIPGNRLGRRASESRTCGSTRSCSRP
jgi:predicted TIM-barrel fold metal-dependent hydrolase